MDQALCQRNKLILHPLLDDIQLEGNNKTGTFLTIDADSLTYSKHIDVICHYAGGGEIII